MREKGAPRAGGGLRRLRIAVCVRAISPGWGRCAARLRFLRCVPQTRSLRGGNSSGRKTHQLSPKPAGGAVQGAGASVSAHAGCFRPLSKKCRQTPYFNSTTFPPLFFTFRSRRSGAVLRTRDWLLDNAGASLGASWLLTPLCKKCRQTPILTLPLSPHFFLTLPVSAVGARGGAGGARLVLDGAVVGLGTTWLLTPLCEKCRQC